MDFPCSFRVRTTYSASPKTVSNALATISGYCKHARSNDKNDDNDQLCMTKFKLRVMDHSGLHTQLDNSTGTIDDILIECDLSGDFVLYQQR
jgi:hypothetical protein